jgi:FkbM family methyltransferase
MTRLERVRRRANSALARRFLQPLWSRLDGLCLQGMNIGNDLPPALSGEAWVLRNLRSLLGLGRADSLVVFDVGANVGDYTRLANSTLSPHVHIHAFEPSLKTYARLAESAAGLLTVTSHNFGLGAHDGFATLYSNPDAGGLASVYKRDLNHLGLSLDSQEVVRLRTLDSVCLEHSVDRIHLLKLDVEGNELDVLLAAKRLLVERRVLAIQFEFGGCNVDSRTYFRDFYRLLADDFQVSRILVDGLVHIDRYGEHLERFQLTNMLALLRDRPALEKAV